MEENYPFSGTGNLFRFYQGLISIGCQNKIIFIYDNDTAGIDKYQKSLKLLELKNIKLITLPDLDEFKHFKTISPNGYEVSDINGKAAAIECFLDLCYKNNEELAIRWSSFIKKMSSYQGELINKDMYVRKFKTANLLNGSYDIEKLTKLIEHIVKIWCQ